MREIFIISKSHLKPFGSKVLDSLNFEVDSLAVSSAEPRCDPKYIFFTLKTYQTTFIRDIGSLRDFAIHLQELELVFGYTDRGQRLTYRVEVEIVI